MQRGQASGRAFRSKYLRLRLPLGANLICSCKALSGVGSSYLDFSLARVVSGFEGIGHGGLVFWAVGPVFACPVEFELGKALIGLAAVLRGVDSDAGTEHRGAARDLGHEERA